MPTYLIILRTPWVPKCFQTFSVRIIKVILYFGSLISFTFTENNSQEKAATSMRAASLLYMVTEGNNSHAPLLHSDTPPNSTNHDRLHELGDLKLSEDIVCSSSGDLSH